MIKVVHIQKHLPSSGNAAFRLHSAILKVGIESTMFSLSSDIPKNNYVDHLGKKALLRSIIDSKLQNWLKRETVVEFGIFSYPILGHDITNNEHIRNADVIYLHWVVGGFLNLNNINKIAALNKPTIIFMHDMWYITGGCHYSFKCEKYINECHECQVFSKQRIFDISTREFRIKKKIYSKYNNLYFVSPSKWLYDCAVQSKLLENKPIYRIPNIVDNSLFKSIDKVTAKKIFNIPPEVKVLAFGATSLNSPYKGMKYLQQALELLKDDFKCDEIMILTFGGILSAEVIDKIPFKLKMLGRLHDDYSTMLAYNAADVFIAPSLAETFGLVILEAILCGTPVVGFNIGGIPDIINHKKNGYLANYKDASDLAEGIKYCLENKMPMNISDDLYPEHIIEEHLKLIENCKRLL
jgi:glycosyltransferase involved in cell wall biosynthesis